MSPYMMEGKCVYKKKADGSKGKSMGCSETEEEAKKHMQALYANESKSLASFSMRITKATIPEKGKKDRKMRILMVTSDTGEDAYEERMSVDLYNDFVERINGNTPVPEPFKVICEEGWNGGMPYQSISHYKSGGGKNVPGNVEEVYVDGDLLKAKTSLDETPLGLAVWKSVCQDIEDRNKPLEERAFENPVRISIGFLDLEHKHVLDDGGEFLFTRKSLEDKCEKCADGINGKVYLKGQLVHLAYTRVPANPRTSVEVMRMGEEIKSRKDDAESIVRELADELVDKSLAKEDVLVVKAKKEEKDLESYAWGVKSAFYNKFDPPKPMMWVRSVTEKNVIVSEEDKLYRVGYTENDGEFSFDERSKWEEVMVGLIPVKSEAQADEWIIEFKSEEVSEEVMAEKPNQVVEEPVEEVKPEVVVAPQKSKVELAVEEYMAKLAEVKKNKLHGDAAAAELQPIMNNLAQVTKEEITDPVDNMANVVRSAVAEAIAAYDAKRTPELVAEVLKAVGTNPVQAQETPRPRSLLLERSAVPQPIKELSAIEKIAYNSTIGVATGQRV